MLFLSCVCYALVHICLLMPGKGMTSWLSFVISTCKVRTFPLVFWVKCGDGLYRFLIFALFLSLNVSFSSLQPSIKAYKMGHYRTASETPPGWRFAGGPIVARDCRPMFAIGWKGKGISCNGSSGGGFDCSLKR